MTAQPASDEQPHLAESRSAIDAKLRKILCDVLGLDAGDVAAYDNDTGLFGYLPELDSMAVAGLLIYAWARQTLRARYPTVEAACP